MPHIKKNLRFEYLNHKGDYAIRTVRPIEIVFTKKEPYYPEPTWLLVAWDLDKQDGRSFALTNIRGNITEVDP